MQRTLIRLATAFALTGTLAACDTEHGVDDACGHGHMGRITAALGEAGTIGRVGGSVPRPYFAAALPAADDAVRAVNLVDGETVHNDLQLVSGDAPSWAEAVEVSRDGQLLARLPVGHGRFVGLVELAEGENVLRFEAAEVGGAQRVSAHVVTVHHAPSTSPRTVEFVYAYLQGTDGGLLTVDGEAIDRDEVARRIGLMGRVMQGLMAEYGHEAGLARKTFTLARDGQGAPRVTPFELPFGAAQLDAWAQTDGNDALEIYDAVKPAVAEALGCETDDSLGFEMRCGGRIVIILSNLDAWSAYGNTYFTAINAKARLHSWPASVEQLFARFADDRPVPAGLVDAGMPIYEALGRAVGATMHELGHTLALQHGGVADELEMMRASGHGLYRMFTTADVEAGGAPSHLQPRPGLGPVAALWLQDSPFTDTDDSRQPVGPCPTMTLDRATGALSIDAQGAPLRAVFVDQGTTDWYMTWPGAQPRSFSGSLAAIAADMAPYTLASAANLKTRLVALTADGQRCVASDVGVGRSDQSPISVGDFVDDDRAWFAWKGHADGAPVDVAVDGDLFGEARVVALDGQTAVALWQTRQPGQAYGAGTAEGYVAFVERDGAAPTLGEALRLPEAVRGDVQAVNLGDGRALVLWQADGQGRAAVLERDGGAPTLGPISSWGAVEGGWSAAALEEQRVLVAGADHLVGLQVTGAAIDVIETAPVPEGVDHPTLVAVNGRNTLLATREGSLLRVVRWAAGNPISVGAPVQLGAMSLTAVDITPLTGQRFAVSIAFDGGPAPERRLIAVYRDGVTLTLGETEILGETARQAMVGVDNKTALVFADAGADPLYPEFGLLGRVVRVKEQSNAWPVIPQAPRPLYQATSTALDAVRLDEAHALLLTGADAQTLQLRVVRR